MNFLRLSTLLAFSLLLTACTDYDVDTADTPANRQGFAKHLGFEPDRNVTAVYYYADEFGADAQYQLSFECPKEIAEQIVRDLSLQPKPDDYSGLNPRDDLKWWQPESTKTLPMWIKTAKADQHHSEFWYSEETRRAYYHEYSN